MATPLLQYDYGNQAVRSRVTISKAGVGKVEEVVDTKHHAHQAHRGAAQDAQSADRRRRRCAAEAAAGRSDLDGQPRGRLFCHERVGQAGDHRVSDSRPPMPGVHDIILVNRSANARKIYDFVTGLTQNDMPKK